MTFVGKILVIVIMVFALFFLALSTVVFTTSVDWKTELTKANEAKKKVTDEKNRLENNVKDAEAKLALAKNDTDKAEVDFKNKIKELTSENARRQGEITDQRKIVETSLQEVKKAQDEAEARISEATVLRQNLKTIQDQRDSYLLQKTDLNQRIIILERELEVAKANNSDLRNRVAVLQGVMRKAGLNDNPSDATAIGSPPDVEGEVTRVDASGKTIEISIGKDDGLVEGHELIVFRTKPTPDFVCRVKIISADPDQASARVIGGTYQGKKIQEGDNVATKIRPRS